MDTTRDLVEQRIRAAAKSALGVDPDVLEVMRPQTAEHGDFSTNLAMQLAKPLRKAPREIATALVEALRTNDDNLIARAEVAGPGFLNVWLDPRHVEQSVDAIRAAGLDYGRSHSASPKKINVEFVSANPTGPLTVGNARGAFVGDLLCRVLEAVGHKVTREYYFNDSGGQVEKLGLSVWALHSWRPVPDDGYHGDYVGDIAKELPPEVRQQAEADEAKQGWIVGAWASERIRAGIERSLANLGVHFDVWTGEASIHERGWVERGIEQLKQAGYMYEQDGALWFKSTQFGDDKDRVVIRSNGEPTYFASDIGYVLEKFSRGFDELIYIWGADHHGTVARLKNAAQALGHDRDAVNVLLIAWVRFVRNGEEVSMSKRTGEFVTLDELLGRGRRRRRALVLRLARTDDGHRLRHRAGAQAVEREPGLLRPVRPRADQLDPAQGHRLRALGNRDVGWRAGKRRRRAGPGQGPLAPAGHRPRRGTRARDAVDHGLRD